MKTHMYYFKELLYDNKVFIIYRHEQNMLGVFLDNGDDMHLLKFVYNTRQCREIIRLYKYYM